MPSIRFLFLLAMFIVMSGCASMPSIPEKGEIALRPGGTFRFQDREFRLDSVQEDFVFMQNVKPDGKGGEVAGWVEEVFRVSRYDLGQGRWHMHPKLSGLYLRWLGGDGFAISRDAAVLGPDEPKVLSE